MANLYAICGNPMERGCQRGAHDSSSSLLSTQGRAVHTRRCSSVVNYTGIAPKIEYKMVPPEPLWKLAATAGPYVRLAALSGTSAVILGAVGSHRKYPEDKGPELRQVFETASRYHFFHALAMMGLPLCRMPFLAATFMMSGTLLFCGTCYYYAFTGDKRFSRFTPIGGTCLILGWLAMCI